MTKGSCMSQQVKVRFNELLDLTTPSFMLETFSDPSAAVERIQTFLTDCAAHTPYENLTIANFMLVGMNGQVLGSAMEFIE